MKSVRPRVCPSICLSVKVSIHLSLCPSICPSIRLSIPRGFSTPNFGKRFTDPAPIHNFSAKSRAKTKIQRRMQHQKRNPAPNLRSSAKINLVLESALILESSAKSYRSILKFQRQILFGTGSWIPSQIQRQIYRDHIGHTSMHCRIHALTILPYPAPNQV